MGSLGFEELSEFAAWREVAARDRAGRRRVAAGLAGALTAAGLFALLAVLRGAGFYVAAAAASAAVSAVLAGLWWRDRSPGRRALRDAYERHLYAEAAVGTFQAALGAFSVALREARARDGAPGGRVCEHEALAEVLRAAQFDTSEPDLAALLLRFEESFQAELGRRHAAWTAGRDDLAARIEELEAAREGVAEDLQRVLSLRVQLGETYASLRARCEAIPEAEALLYGADTPGPETTLRIGKLRAMVDEAQAAAARGQVTESRVAGVVLREETRWSTVAPVGGITRELLALLEPEAPTEDADPGERRAR
ncbi:MAG: hypothetical protein HY909_05275 [Deltaproteobacteria bacterium]|nr:hypothetical protein [Deltaproteobacteria bacterium]